MSIASLIEKAKRAKVAANTKSRSSWAQFLPVIAELPIKMTLTAKVDWLIEQKAITSTQRVQAYYGIAGLLRRRKKQTQISTVDYLDARNHAIITAAETMEKGKQ